MKQILLMIAVVALVGCGEKTTPAELETNAKPKAAVKKPEPAKVFTNTLGMKFVPVAATEAPSFNPVVIDQRNTPHE
jgi:predicted lipoprotein